MIVRFYDIVVDSVNDGVSTLTDLGREFTLNIPDRDLSEATERAEHISIMMDMASECAGCDVSSFRYENVE